MNSTLRLNFPASLSHIWTVCSGQPQLSARIDFKEPVKNHTLKGRVSDWVVQTYLKGHPTTDESKDGIIIDETMHLNAEIFYNHVISVLNNCSSGNRLIIPTNIQYDCFVTYLMPSAYRQLVDFRHYDPETKTLYIWDYKDGFKPVEVINNRQMLYYALDGATINVVEHVIMFIVQPNAWHPDGYIREWVIDRTMLLTYANVYRTAYENAYKVDAELVVGNHCHYCKARGLCPAFYEKVIELATVLDAPPSLTPEEVGTRLKLMEELNTRSGEAKSALHSQGIHYVQNGKTLPGYKLSRSDTNRQLKGDGEDKLIIASPMFNVNPDDLYVKKLKPLGQLEKLLPKEMINLCTIKPVGQYVLIPAEDPQEGFDTKAAAVFNIPFNKPDGAI